MKRHVAGLFLIVAIIILGCWKCTEMVLKSNDIEVKLESIPSIGGARQTYYIVSLCDADGKRLVSAERLAKDAYRFRAAELVNSGHGIWADLPAKGKIFCLGWKGQLPLPRGEMLYAEVGKSVPGSMLNITVGKASQRLDVSKLEGDSPIRMPLGVVSASSHTAISMVYRLLFPLLLLLFSAHALVTGRWRLGKTHAKAGWMSDGFAAVGNRLIQLHRSVLHVARDRFGSDAIGSLSLRKNIYLCRVHVVGLILIGFVLFAWFPKPSSIDSDPESAYVANCILLAEGLPLTHSDHPGTTTQLIGALLAHLGEFSSENIVARYDRFRIQFGMVLFAACALLWLSIIGQKPASFAWVASTVAGTVLCFMGREGTYALSAVSSESTLLLTGILVLALLVRRNSCFRWSSHVALAFVAGFALAAKINAVPFCVGILIVSTATGICTPKRFIARSTLFGFIMASCFLSVIFFAGAVPNFLSFLNRLVQKRGIQGKGAVRTEFSDFLPEWSGLLNLWKQDWSLIVLTTAAVILALVLMFIRWRKDRVGAIRVMGWLVAILGSFVPLIEHNYWRYFLPGIIAIVGLLIIECSEERQFGIRACTVLFCLLVTLPAFRWASHFPALRRAQESEYVRHSAWVTQAILDYHPDLLAMGFNVNTSLGFVQLLGSYHGHFVGAQPPPVLDPYRQYGVELGSYLPWVNRIYFRGRTIDPFSRAIMIVTSTPLTDPLLSYARLVFEGSGKRLFIYMVGKGKGSK